MPQYPSCHSCYFFANSSFLRCAVHPSGDAPLPCPDYQLAELDRADLFFGAYDELTEPIATNDSTYTYYVIGDVNDNSTTWLIKIPYEGISTPYLFGTFTGVLPVYTNSGLIKYRHSNSRIYLQNSIDRENMNEVIQQIAMLKKILEECENWKRIAESPFFRLCRFVVTSLLKRDV